MTVTHQHGSKVRKLKNIKSIRLSKYSCHMETFSGRKREIFKRDLIQVCG